MSTDKFSTYGDDADNPARQAFEVVPSDTAELSTLPRALLIGGAGNLVLRAVDSAADVAIAVSAGQLVPVRAQYVRATGTTATGIVGLA